jgi:ATP synthase protein I
LEPKKVRDALFLSALPLEIAGAVAIGAVAGYFLDKRFNTQPWLFAVFTTFGVVAAVRALIRDIKKYSKQLKDEEKGGGDSKPQ